MVFGILLQHDNYGRLFQKIYQKIIVCMFKWF